jgi:hypothetical protein
VNENDDNEASDDVDDDGFGEQLAQLGFDITELGMLTLPDGRVIGHRALLR